MAHYAFVDQQNIVNEVIVGRDETDGIPSEEWERHYAEFRPGMICRQCSYNTRDGVHLRGGRPHRGNFPGIGWRYDEAADAFLPPEIAQENQG